MVYCNRCPIEKECKEKKKEVLEPYREDIKKEIEQRLKDFCPLKAVLDTIEEQVPITLDNLPLYRGLKMWKSFFDVVGKLAERMTREEENSNQKSGE